MTDDLRILLILKELDEHQSALRTALARFPEQRADLDNKVASERRRLDALKARVADLQKRRRDRERDIESASTEERKFQGQLPSVKKNEEYTALLHEIEGVKTRRSALETEVLEMMDEEEKAAAERPPIERALSSAEGESAERRARIDREETEARERFAQVEAQRAHHIQQLTPLVRSRYERIHASREGRAVVAIQKGACGGCYRAQPPQMLVEARRGDRLLTCDGCGRLMIWVPESS